MAASAASGNGGTTAGAASSTLADRWRIDPDAPLATFDLPSAQAFAATELPAQERPLLAFLCTSGLPFRAESARLLAGSSIEGLLGLIAYGIVDWPAEQARVPALLYERPKGDPVCELFGKRIVPGCGDEPIRALLRPIGRGLRVLQRLNIAHRGIRPDNLWFEDAANRSAVAGCALSGPAGWDQPSPFEPLERAMAERAGRGEGDTAADIYALGVTVLWLVTGPPAWSFLPDAEVLSARVGKGSYSALTQGVRLPEWLVEPLRCMLADDPDQRWTLRELQAWLDGMPLPMHISPPLPSAEGPFVFSGKPFIGLRELAMAMARDVPAAAQAIRGGSLQTWLRHGLRDPIRAKRLDELVEGATYNAAEIGGGDDALVARALLLIDETAPIRYRDAAFSVDGFGPVLAKRVLDGESVQTLAEPIAIGLPKLCLMQSRGSGAAKVERARRLVALSGYLRDPRLGFGVERCLYVANPGLPCLSLSIATCGVVELADLLRELEAAAAAATDDKLLDRHVAGFIAARIGNEAAAAIPLSGLSDPDAATSATAMLALLAFVQARHPDAPRPRLARWIGRKLPAAIASIRHRPTRVALEREAARKIALGDLCGLHVLISDPEPRRRDHSGFRTATAAWKRAEMEIAALDRLQAQRQLAAQARGARVAAIIGLSGACVSIGATILLALR